MAKNITIKEGLTAKNFTDVEKLSTNVIGGGTCNWIPEDEVLDYVDLKEITINKNGTYKASDKNCDGFSKVKVNVEADLIPQKMITANGEYDAQEEGHAGYVHISVNVPNGGDAPYTVRFFDDNNNLIKTQENVPWGGYASCTALDGTIVNGLYFKGWNPVPKNVKANINCYPVRGDYQIVAGEIADDWETIVADGGAHYPLGSYKPLVMEIPATVYDENTRVVQGIYDKTYGSTLTGKRIVAQDILQSQVACHMVKVAEGEDGSTSTWISDGLFDFYTNHIFNQANTNVSGYKERMNLYTPDGVKHYVREDVAGMDWGTCAARQYLNTEFFNALPLVLKNAIIPVNKTYKATNLSPQRDGFGTYDTLQFLDKTSIDHVWIPSMAEFKTLVQSASNYVSKGYANALELSGIDYSAVFTPAYGANFMMRSIFREVNQSYLCPTYYYTDGTLGPNGNNGKAPFGFCL